MRRSLMGAGTAVTLVLALGAVMLPLRGHISVATSALVLVVPVVAGVAVGGFGAGAVGVVAGFLVYDFVFIPPYYTLSVGAAQNWAALAVYVVVMLVVARVVASLESARSRAERREEEVRRLFELSELLVADKPVGDLFETIVRSARDALAVEGVSLLMPIEGKLKVVASAGACRVDGLDGSVEAAAPVALETIGGSADTRRLVTLSASGGPVGILVLNGYMSARPDRALLATFSNQLALALERARLREEALRASLLEEVDRLRRSLVGAVSHDLRTPLATIKVAASSLRYPGPALSSSDAAELAGLIDEQADRLDRLVANLLDMTRIQAGSLVVRSEPMLIQDLVADALGGLGSSFDAERVVTEGLEVLPPVEADPVLVGQVLANLLENAARHSPDGSPVTVAGRIQGTLVELAVCDHGPGVAEADREAIFGMFNRREAGGRAGLGLAIAKAFVEAHDQRIWIEDRPGWGACFVFGLPLARSLSRVPTVMGS